MRWSGLGMSICTTFVSCSFPTALRRDAHRHGILSRFELGHVSVIPQEDESGCLCGRHTLKISPLVLRTRVLLLAGASGKADHSLRGRRSLKVRGGMNCWVCTKCYFWRSHGYPLCNEMLSIHCVCGYGFTVFPPTRAAALLYDNVAPHVHVGGNVVWPRTFTREGMLPFYLYSGLVLDSVWCRPQMCRWISNPSHHCVKCDLGELEFCVTSPVH